MPLPELMTRKTSHAEPINPIVVSNIILSGATLLLLSFYVVQANIIAASRYQMKSMSEEIASLNDLKVSLTAERSRLETPSELSAFARNRNMVEAKEVTYLFENGNVALRR